MYQTESKVVSSALPCPSPECDSSDAYFLYDDGHGYCFSCSNYVPPSELEYTYEYLPWRGISRETMEKYNVLTKVGPDGSPHEIGFPYGDCHIIRSYVSRNFHFKGDSSTSHLFGKSSFNPGSSKEITLCEGGTDALSAYEILGSKHPVVAVRSSSSARKECELDFDYLNSFDKIYICFDNDPPGQSASKSVATLFDPAKVYIVQITTWNDVNDFLQHEEKSEFFQLWSHAKQFQPTGILSSFSEIEKALNDKSAPCIATYPFHTWQEMTYGIREGECVLLTALEGVGKTEIIRAIEYHILQTTDLNLGIIHLEEDKLRTIKGFAGYHLQTAAHLPISNLSNEQILQAYKAATKNKDERLHIYSHFGSDDPDIILDTVRRLVTIHHCKVVCLDHISMVVSGLDTDDERKALDYISTRLAMMAQQLEFCLIFISHVNDEGLTRGSRNIGKIAHTRIHLQRDLLSSDESTRNTTKTTFYKNRFGSITGPSGDLYFDFPSFTIKEIVQKELPPPN